MPISRSKKLALLAMADSADKLTRVAVPGLERIQTWANVGKSQALNLIAELVKDGLIVRKSAGRKGHMAEFWVLPHGCCSLHGSIFTGSESQDPMDSDKGSEDQDPKDALKGSEPEDPKESSGSETQDPITPLGSDLGSDKGSEPQDPFVSTYLNPSLRSGLPAREAKRPTRASRLPDDWQPTTADVAWAREQGFPDSWSKQRTEIFRDHWHSESGAKASKLDWSKAWKNWLRRDAERRGPQRNPAAMTPTEKMGGWLTVGRRDEPEQTQLRAIEG